MRVTVRGVLVCTLLTLGLWGLFQLLEGVENQGLVEEVTCPYLNIGPDEEEAGQPMRPGDRCDPGEHRSIRTYPQQRDFQQQQHRRVVLGAWCLGTGAAGAALAGLLTPRPSKTAVSPGHRPRNRRTKP